MANEDLNNQELDRTDLESERQPASQFAERASGDPHLAAVLRIIADKRADFAEVREFMSAANRQAVAERLDLAEKMATAQPAKPEIITGTEHQPALPKPFFTAADLPKNPLAITNL